jgi:mannose-1-phosphate guanylyltransferase
MYAVIMAGGQGTRLWPLSRQKKPKQLQSFIGDKTLIAETYERLLPLFSVAKIYISTTPDYKAEIQKFLPGISPDNYIVEPCPMGTAAACGLATSIINKADPDSSVIFLPADHTIKDKEEFLKIIEFAEDVVGEHQDHILTIGINPTKPDTGLGYIQMDSQIEKSNGFRVFSVKKFIEKPSLEKAEEYVASWEYLWNAGIFIWKTNHMLDLFEKNLPNTFKLIKKITESIGTPDYDKTLETEYRKVDNTSIDYGIMEKTKKILVIPGDFGWSDIGSWGVLHEVLSHTHGSTVISSGNHIGIDNSNLLVMATGKLIATVGLKNIVIIDTPDALLICDSKESHKVKELTAKLKKEGKHLYL